MPSAVSVSLGLVLGPYIPLAMVFGAVFFQAWEKRFPNAYERLGVAVASGMHLLS